MRDDGAVYLVTRRNVVLLRDTDNDGVADKQDELLRLETEDDYPHNGLSGIARDGGRIADPRPRREPRHGVSPDRLPTAR